MKAPPRRNPDPDSLTLFASDTICSSPVSYTHLDVYKRQIPSRSSGRVDRSISPAIWARGLSRNNTGPPAFRASMLPGVRTTPPPQATTVGLSTLDKRAQTRASHWRNTGSPWENSSGMVRPAISWICLLYTS